jgi:hypothetical protein
VGLAARLALYKQVEAKRNRPLIVYVTSNRVNAAGGIAGDSVPELLDQLQRLPEDNKELDLLIVSDGGDPTVAWRIVSLIRERATKFSVFVPQAAYSAATLIVLGADEVVMHPNGNLGPTDPQIRIQRRSGKDGATDAVVFGSEDLMAFLRFSRDQVGLNAPEQMLSVYSKFCDEVGTVGVGVSARSALLSVSMGEKLLLLHMTGEAEKQKAHEISEKLTKDYLHHGYPVNRTEAKEIGLKVAERDPALEALMWQIWGDLSEELRLREPHNPLRVLRENPACQALFAPLLLVQLPANLPPQLAQQAHQQILAQVQVEPVPPAPFETIHAVIESSRHASRFITNGLVFGTRLADQQIRLSTVTERQGWVTVPLDGSPPAAVRAAPQALTPLPPAPPAPAPQQPPADPLAGSELAEKPKARQPKRATKPRSKR